MNVAILHGQNHQGCTYHLTHHLLDKLHLSTIELKEFYFSNTPSCLGCNQCFYKGETHCPHYNVIHPIIEALDKADLILLTSPCYCMGISGSLKCFLDHLAYLWLAHRPHKEMFHKVGVVISTAGGTGSKKVTKDLSTHLLCWGIPQIYTLPIVVNALNWSDIPPKIVNKIEHQTDKLSIQLTKALYENKVSFKSRMVYQFMKSNQKNNVWNPLDKTYWQQQGLLDNSHPWH